mmetsp:Transcript_8078/g.18056  ORF Transcript_8078/g.18056 Transcript_8078/m.18056 type:complete len:295 (+) Transcript_8078:798-1682(+)
MCGAAGNLSLDEKSTRTTRSSGGGASQPALWRLGVSAMTFAKRSRCRRHRRQRRVPSSMSASSSEPLRVVRASVPPSATAIERQSAATILRRAVSIDTSAGQRYSSASESAWLSMRPCSTSIAPPSLPLLGITSRSSRQISMWPARHASPSALACTACLCAVCLAMRDRTAPTAPPLAAHVSAGQPHTPPVWQTSTFTLGRANTVSNNSCATAGRPSVSASSSALVSSGSWAEAHGRIFASTTSCSSARPHRRNSAAATATCPSRQAKQSAPRPVRSSSVAFAPDCSSHSAAWR